MAPVFALNGLLDYQAILGHSNGCDLLGIEFRARPGHEFMDLKTPLTRAKLTAIASACRTGA